MDEHSQIIKKSPDHHAQEDAIENMTLEALIATVSHLESGIRARNPIAAYFLERCKCALEQDALWQRN